MLVFVLLDEHADNFHKRSEGVRFVFADFIDEPIEQGNQSFIFGFGVGDEDGVSQRRPGHLRGQVYYHSTSGDLLTFSRALRSLASLAGAQFALPW